MTWPRGERLKTSELAGVAVTFQREEDGRAIVVMVGDDREHSVELDSLEELDDSEYCGSCGQIGCAWG